MIKLINVPITWFLSPNHYLFLTICFSIYYVLKYNTNKRLMTEQNKRLKYTLSNRFHHKFQIGNNIKYAYFIIFIRTQILALLKVCK